MHLLIPLVPVLLLTTTAHSFHISSILSSLSSPLSRRQSSSCPQVWTNISKSLTNEFLSNGQCNDAARAAIRAAFHDCFNGACDGSLILANECSNSENRGLSGICGTLGSMAEINNVGVADLIQFAAAHAIKTCPQGPSIPVYIGRKDSSTASPTGILPSGTASGDSLLELFESKGFSATELAALIGAHTAARQFNADASRAGAALDSTPGEWDVKYYSETLKHSSPFTLQADRNLAEHAVVGKSFRSFSGNQAGWNAAFVPAMSKLSLMGVDAAGLIDCTFALPSGTKKRDIKRASVFDRLHW
ncbi:heme peroxidase [Delitschia confertaspora ATCC 74209]|uniref:Peroxidase n=1 Tax=Delitschia confertaspora ATCC 74209 TaxID=1513339 RepID=A0A9P4JR56_9PLEO|nr:heme peroxidase [Delitschia confertaspora ATCC 74209]